MVLAVVLWSAATLVRAAPAQSATQRRLAAYATATPDDAISRLQARIDTGAATLRFDDTWGYLPSLLEALKIPAASQNLVFSKTSFQLDKIAPWSPRAIYFGDDVYLGWVQKGTVIEVAAVDPVIGATFYTLDQQPAAKPQFLRQTHNCLQCHDSSLNTGGVPGFMVQSVYTDRYGYPLPSPHDPVSSDRTPLSERFGGWYVTGTHGAQVHMGNVAAPEAAARIGNPRVYIQGMDLAATGNVTDLSGRFNVKPYLAPTSDIAALMLLIHQTSVHNLMIQAAFDAGGPNEAASAEAVVRALLFVGEARLTEPVSGSPAFAAAFATAGPRDANGRSLRDLDLKTRLLRYPLSYLVYSSSFDALPPSVKATIARRLNDILSGQDTQAVFQSITDADRAAIREILAETKPGFIG